ncbi:MAG: peptidase M48, partial [Pseudomonadota bacterium]
MTFHTCTRLASMLVLTFALALPARAVALLRDADVEYALAQVAAPVLRAAGLNTRTKILVVDDGSLNAFVVGNDAIYINSG